MFFLTYKIFCHPVVSLTFFPFPPLFILSSFPLRLSLFSVALFSYFPSPPINFHFWLVFFSCHSVFILDLLSFPFPSCFPVSFSVVLSSPFLPHSFLSPFLSSFTSHFSFSLFLPFPCLYFLSFSFFYLLSFLSLFLFLPSAAVLSANLGVSLHSKCSSHATAHCWKGIAFYPNISIFSIFF